MGHTLYFILAVLLSFNAVNAANGLPPGQTPQKVIAGKETECQKQPQTWLCNYYLRLYHCRVNKTAHTCAVQRRDYYCNFTNDKTKCAAFTRYAAQTAPATTPIENAGGNNSNTSSSTSSSSSSGSTTPVGNVPQDTTPQPSTDHGSSAPLCQLMGNCSGGASSGGANTSSSGGSGTDIGNGSSSSGSMNNNGSGATSFSQLKSQYPHLYNENLPFNGLFYGYPFSGDNFELVRIGGEEYGKELTMRFRAERSGTLTYINYNNRYDPLGRGYSTGNGGSIHAEIRPDDGTSRHLPTDTVISKTNSIIPKYNDMFVDLKLATPVKVEAGKLYHIVFVQATGAYASTNGASVFHPQDPAGGPFWGNDNLMFHRNHGVWTSSNSKGKSTDYILGQSYASLGYSDGIEVGIGGWGYANNYPHIGGSNRIRQVFTIDGPTRNVNGVWFRLARRPGNTGAMVLDLKDANGRALHTQSIPAVNFSEGTIPDKQRSIRWVYIDFGKTVPFQSGLRYSMELSSPSSPSTGYVIHAYLDLAARGYNKDRNMWRNAQAEISTNGGKSWSGKIEEDRLDYGFGFTLEGGPKSIKSIGTTAAW